MISSLWLLFITVYSNLHSFSAMTTHCRKITNNVLQWKSLPTGLFLSGSLKVIQGLWGTGGKLGRTIMQITTCFTHKLRSTTIFCYSSEHNYYLLVNTLFSSVICTDLLITFSLPLQYVIPYLTNMGLLKDVLIVKQSKAQAVTIKTSKAYDNSSSQLQINNNHSMVVVIY